MSYKSKPTEVVYNLLVESIRLFFKQSGHKKALLGLSGGIDSAVVAALAVKALGAENVHGVLMPSQFSTLHSINDAVELANNLKMSYDIVYIEKIYNKFIKELNSLFKDNKWDTTQENIQARVRGTILMAYSNRTSALVLNTSNKSEVCAGYGTLYGDLAGSLMVLADVYKMQVYELANYINIDEVLIPLSTINKPPSAELRHEQKDSDSLPDYSILDSILFSLIELGKSPENIIEEGADPALVNRILSLRKASSFKKHQLAPLIKISDHPVLGADKCVTTQDDA